MKKLIMLLMTLSLGGKAFAAGGVCRATTVEGAKILVQIKRKPIDPRNAYVDQGYTALVQVFKPRLVEQRLIKDIRLQDLSDKSVMLESKEGFTLHSHMGNIFTGKKLVQYVSKHTAIQYMHVWMDCKSN